MLPLLPAIFLSKVRYRKGRVVLWLCSLSGLPLYPWLCSPFALSDPLPTRLRHDLFECLLHFPRRLRYPSTCFLPAVHCHPPSCHLPAQSGYLPARRCLPALSECLPVRYRLPALASCFLLSLAPAQIRHNLTAELP